MAFEFLSHTADLKIRATGATLEEAFKGVAEGMVETLTDLPNVQKVIKKEFSLKANRLESLLYDFIDHLIFLIDTEDFLAVDFENFTIDPEQGTLSCTAVGDSITNYESFGHMKAATYHEMKIEQGPQVLVEVVIDI